MTMISNMIKEIKNNICSHGEMDVVIELGGVCKVCNRKIINYIGKLNKNGITHFSKYLDNNEITNGCDASYENIHYEILNKILEVLKTRKV